MVRTAAFFDLEGTLTRDATDMVLIKAAYRAGYFTSWSLVGILSWSDVLGADADAR